MAVSGSDESGVTLDCCAMDEAAVARLAQHVVEYPDPGLHLVPVCLVCNLRVFDVADAIDAWEPH